MGGGGVWHLQQIYFNSFFPDCRIQVNIKFPLKKFHRPLLFLKYFHYPTKFSGIVLLPTTLPSRPSWVEFMTALLLDFTLS